MADDPAQYLCALCVLYQQKMVVGCFLALFVVGVFFILFHYCSGSTNAFE